ncbi:MAG: hypothetical protein ABI780_01280 [Ardenticatenales bacterium]
MLGLCSASPPSARAQPPVAPWPRFGLAHVDVMDLHVARDATGAPVAHEVLPAADLADRFAKAAASGSGWDRWSMYWDLIEGRQGQPDWTAVDAMVARDRAAGLRTLAILQGTPGFAVDHAASRSLIRSASPARGPQVSMWPRIAPLQFGAAPDPREADWSVARSASSALGAHPRPLHGDATDDLLAAVPRGLDGPIFRYTDGGAGDDPARALAVSSDQPWALFVAAAVARYRPGGALGSARGWAAGDGVRAWEIGNEPNLSFFWSGTAAEYARYLQVADLAVHFVDSQATVLHGGIADTSGATAWYRQFMAALASRAAGSAALAERYGWFFDAAAWHWYTYPRLLVDGPTSARALLAEHGLTKPIWVTEMGVPVWDDYPGPCWDARSPHRATQKEQSAYLWQSLTEGVASDVAVMIAFQAYDDCGNGPASYDAFGLVRNHASNQCWQPPAQTCWRFDPATAGVPRPAFDAFRTAARELAGATLLWRPAAADGWQRVLFYRPPQDRVMVLWNTTRDPLTVDVFSTGPAGTVFEAADDGRIVERAAAPAGGKYALRLPGATNRNTPGSGAAAMAGHPVIVVERDTAAPFRSEVVPLPPTSPTAFDLVVRAADGGTGVGAVQLWAATADPAAGGAWAPFGPERAWPASPLSGEAPFGFVGTPGTTYYFAVSARDRAGNRAVAPAVAQAWTRIDGVGPPPTAGPPPTPTRSPTPTSTTAPVPSATASPSAAPTASPSRTHTPPPSPTATDSPTPSVTPTPSITSTPSITPTPSDTPTPTATRTPIHVVARCYLPVADRGGETSALAAPRSEER